MSLRRDRLTLCAMLRGEHVRSSDWLNILDLANRTLTTPALEPHLETLEAPHDVRAFVREVARRNLNRNERMRAQLGEAALALNRVGVTPLLIKGASRLATQPNCTGRMISDLDLIIRPDQVEGALHSLTTIGYEISARISGERQHAVASLRRPQDVAEIDLHQRPPGPPFFLCGPGLLTEGALRTLNGGVVRIPSAHLQIYFLVMHDQLHDGAYWRGGVDLRHLWDMGELIAGEDGVDWQRLLNLAPTRLVRNAVKVQLLHCGRITGSAIPSDLFTWRDRLNLNRQGLQQDIDVLRTPVALLAIALEPATLITHRKKARQGCPSVGLPAEDVDFRLSFNRLCRILRSRPAGIA